MEIAEPGKNRGELERLLGLFEAGELSGPLTVARLLLVTRDVPCIERWLEERVASGACVPHELLRLLERHRHGCQRVAGLAALFECRQSRVAGGRSGGLAVRDLRAAPHPSERARAEVEEEESGALDALADAELLERAIREIVERLDAWGLLGRARATLELGCCGGGMQAALAPHVGLAAGVDAAPEMVAHARALCSRLGNTRHEVSHSSERTPFADASFDLVFTVDSFPCIVAAGDACVANTFAEVARLLAPGGDFLILDFSFRGDIAADARDVARLASAYGFDLVASGDRPFRLWDGIMFRLRRDR